MLGLGNLAELWDFIPPGISTSEVNVQLVLSTVLALVAVWYCSQRLLTNTCVAAGRDKPSNDKENEIQAAENQHSQPQTEVWNPVEFSYPPVQACTKRVSGIKPIPYRPFKWGPYHVTMGIRNMPWNEWIELDRGHAKYHSIKKHRAKTRGNKAIRVLRDGMNPGVRGGAEAAVELVHELAEYLSRRYPDDFHVVRHSQHPSDSPQNPVENKSTTYSDWGWDGEFPIRQITITALGETYDLPCSVTDGEGAPERAMEIAGYLIQDDLALMIEGSDNFQKRFTPSADLESSGITGEDGRYYFQAGAILLPGFWRMQDKIGLPLDEIHITGHVPQYQGKLQKSMDRFFKKMTVDKPVIRNNYFFQTVGKEMAVDLDPEELGWANYTLGSEDEFEHGEVGNGGKSIKTEPEEKKEETIDQIYLRTERQTLRRLSRSGAIVFTIRTYLTKIVDLAMEEDVERGGIMASRLASALRSWPDDVGKYKGRDRGVWYELVLAYLDEIDREK